MPSPAEQRLRDGLCHPVDVLVLSHGRPRAELSLSGDPRRPATDVLIRLVREPVNLETLRAREHEELTTYGYTDKNAGTYRIPIERAKELMLERNLLPVRGTAAAPATVEKGKGK